MACVWSIEWHVKDWYAVGRGHVNGSTRGMHATMKACFGACFLIYPEGILGVLPMVLLLGAIKGAGLPFGNHWRTIGDHGAP